MLDTRSGFWTVASIAIVSLLTTGAVILLADREDLTYRTFTVGDQRPDVADPADHRDLVGDRGVEPAQRADDLHPGPAPLRGSSPASWSPPSPSPSSPPPSPSRSVPSATSRARPSPGSTRCGTSRPPTCSRSSWPTSWACWSASCSACSSAARPGALVAYFVYQFLLPTLALILAAKQDWFRELQPWVDFDFATGALLEGPLSSQQWAHLAVTGLIWLVVPLAVGLRLVVRAEVK